MHPHLLSELVAIRQADLLAEAERERLARSVPRSGDSTLDRAVVGRLAAVAAVLIILMIGVTAGLTAVADDGAATAFRLMPHPPIRW